MGAIATKEKPQQIAINRGFNPITGNSGASLYIFSEASNHAKSMKTLEEANLRPLKYQEILLLLTTDEKLKESLKGKWFYIEGKGLNKELELYTIDEKGELVERKGEVSAEKTLRVRNGEDPLSFGVLSDNPAAAMGNRFDLNAYIGPGFMAPVVVGVAKDFKLEPSETDTAQNKISIILKDFTPEQLKLLLRDAQEELNVLNLARPNEVKSLVMLAKAIDIEKPA